MGPSPDFYCFFCDVYWIGAPEGFIDKDGFWVHDCKRYEKQNAEYQKKQAQRQ